MLDVCCVISDERPREPDDDDTGGAPQPCQEEKLLLILSNSSYTKSHVGPRLIDCFVGNGYPENSREEIVSDANILSQGYFVFHAF